MIDPTIAEIQDFRRAARYVVRDTSLSPAQRRAVLVDLAAEARQSPAAPLAQEAVWAESREFLGDPERVVPPADPAEGTLRRLVAAGRSRCPECRRRLPSTEELDRLRRRRDMAIAEVALFEAAI